MASSQLLHEYDAAADALAEQAFAYVRDRAKHKRERLSQPPAAAEMTAKLAGAITAEGIGFEQAFSLFTDTVMANCLTPEHPRFLAFVSYAPAVGAVLFD